MEIKRSALNMFDSVSSVVHQSFLTAEFLVQPLAATKSLNHECTRIDSNKKNPCHRCNPWAKKLATELLAQPAATEKIGTTKATKSTKKNKK